MELKIKLSIAFLILGLLMYWAATSFFLKRTKPSEEVENVSLEVVATDVDHDIANINPENNHLEHLREEMLHNLLADHNFEDFALSFETNRAMNRFLLNSEKNGLKIRSSLPQLLSARFKMTEPSKASEFMENFEGISGVELNQPIFRPSPPRITERQINSDEIQNIDDWMGIATDRQNWGFGTTVAVLDSGIDFSHPALRHIEFEEFSFLPEGKKKKKPHHGTAIASIIGGKSKYFEGLAPASKIISIEVMDENGEGNIFAVAQGIVKAADQGARVINLSLGGDIPSETLKNAISYAIQKDALVVAASGNDGLGEVSFPAQYENVIGVGALDFNGRVAEFSNFGDGLDIAAPGVGILSAISGDEYGIFDGTSSASAFVSGAIAAEMSRSKNLSSQQIKRLLFDFSNEVDEPGFDQFSGHGALNLSRIVNRNAVDYHDASVVGYHFSSKHLSNLSDWGTIPFEVIIQNQGSTWINNLKLTINYQGLSKDYHYTNLHPGQTRSENLFLDGSSIKNGIEVTSVLELEDQKDINMKNNFRKSRLFLPKATLP